MSTAAQAAVWRTAGGAATIEEVTLPVTGPGMVLVRLVATGVCHSDLSLARGTLVQPLPAVLGHEGSGRVVEVGEGVTGFAPGDAVLLNWSPACRRCWWCEHGQPFLCAHGADASAAPYARLADGGVVYAGLGVAAFATHTLVAENACIRVADDIDLVEAAVLGCAALTGIGAVTHAARVQPGDTVAVIGLGGVGLCAVQGARLAEAARIVAIDPSPSAAALAQRLGATDLLEPGSDLARRVRALTDGRGVDHAIECVGRAETIRSAWSVTRRGGQATIVGLGAKSDEVTFNALELAHSAKTVRGSMFGNCDPALDVPVLVDHVRAGRLDLAALVTSRVPLSAVDDAFAAMTAGRGGRTLVVFDSDS